MFNPDTGSGFIPLPISYLDPGSRGQKSTDSRIRIRNTCVNSLIFTSVVDPVPNFDPDPTIQIDSDPDTTLNKTNQLIKHNRKGLQQDIYIFSLGTVRGMCAIYYEFYHSK
jgi:hypothetical protein